MSLSIVTDRDALYQYKVDYGGPQPLSYWTKRELMPGMIIDTPGHPLRVLRVTVPADPRGDAEHPGRVGRADAERLPPL